MSTTSSLARRRIPRPRPPPEEPYQEPEAEPALVEATDAESPSEEEHPSHEELPLDDDGELPAFYRPRNRPTNEGRPNRPRKIDSVEIAISSDALPDSLTRVQPHG